MWWSTSTRHIRDQFTTLEQIGKILIYRFLVEVFARLCVYVCWFRFKVGSKSIFISILCLTIGLATFFTDRPNSLQTFVLLFLYPLYVFFFFFFFVCSPYWCATEQYFSNCLCTLMVFLLSLWSLNKPPIPQLFSISFVYNFIHLVYVKMYRGYCSRFVYNP